MRRQIAFVLPRLVPDGGAERVALTLIRHLDRSRFEPTLIVLDDVEDTARDPLPGDVELVTLASPRVRSGIWRLVRTLHARRPALLFSGVGHLNLMLAMARPLLPSGLPVVARESNVVSQINAESPSTALNNTLYRLFYPRLDHVVCQSVDMFDDLVANFGFPAHKASTIANPLDHAAIELLSREPLPEPVRVWESEAVMDRRASPGLRLLAIGRLQRQKGFDILLDAIARLAPGTVRLAIIGKGEELDALRARTLALGLDETVEFLGYRANPYAYIARADALVSSSRYEGLPNVVLEALACRKPVVATPAPGGLREIAMRFGGVRLADAVDAEALANAITAHVRAPRDVPPIDTSAIALGSVIARYETLFERITSGRGGTRSAGGASRSA